MKKIYRYAVLIALGMLLMPGCKKLDEVNTNPNNPLTVTPATQLLSSQLLIGYAMGGDMSRFASIFDQQVYGASRQAASYNVYIAGNADFDAPWGNMYQGMTNLNDMINTATKGGNVYYAGIGKIMLAYALGMSTDVWNSIPYSQAFQGFNNLQPGFDSQQDIYTAIQKLLDDGLIDLNAGYGGNLLPGSDDIVYGGSITNWIALAHGLKARFYLHTGKVVPANLTAAMTEVNSAITGWAPCSASPTGDAYFQFGTSELNAAPWYQFTTSRPGDISFASSTFAQTLQTENDPRLASFIDVGGDALGAFYGNPNSGVRLMSLAELFFIRAELEFATDKASAASDMNTGAITSVTNITGADPTGSAWANTYASETAGSVTLEKIMDQKFIDLYLDPESYTDWRRTGFPTLTP
ncbi:MAG TPA: SusD/RagB family nutrient-binding outer membrane lipoprotein, partial [Chitinophagales bacterium]|nr:SusD/RagB family nutrient-binding outer membrane lipoprotein [Chitinophagales bacterium]